MATKVKFVQNDYEADLKVKLVDYGQDLEVIPVSYDYEASLRVKAVKYGEDKCVKIVQY